jgi:peptide/nickel transport system substrate-binding protein
MRSIKAIAAAALVALFALVLAACGSSSSSKVAGAGAFNTAGFANPLSEPLTGGKRGGVLNVLSETDFEHLDPGIAYFSVDYTVVFSTQRTLYGFKPNQQSESTPDLASGQPEVSNGGKTVTVKLKEGIHFSPPVNREVTSEDVAYAIERGKNPNVANPYIESYMKAIEGLPTATGGPIKGIVTPNKHTIVFHLSEAKPVFLASLVLPITAPVPKEYAEKYDKNKPSNYGAYQVATGPYMLKNEKSGKVLGVGYVPGKSATLVRNPNWTASTDFRPAYLDEIDVHIGGTATVLGRQALTGTNVVQNESSVAQSVVKEGVEKYKSQLEISPGAGYHYIGVDNKVGAFTNINLRKAFFAALDRKAILRAHGGELFGNVATHFLYPGVPGFEQAGGLTGPKGPKFDFAEHPEGDKAIAEKYIKLAGYPSGKYTGGKTVTVVAATGSPLENEAIIVDQTLKNLGFPTKFTAVAASTMFAKYCNVPKEEISVCPSVAWIVDFADPQADLNVTFNGKYISETGNVNWSQTNIPSVNAAMTAAENIPIGETRSKAWAKIDEELVENATAIPLHWDKQANVEGSTVKGVGDLWDVGEWDYGFTSLK